MGQANRPWSSRAPQLVQRCMKMHSLPYGQPLGARLKRRHTAFLGLLGFCFGFFSPSGSMALFPLPFSFWGRFPIGSIEIKISHLPLPRKASHILPRIPFLPTLVYGGCQLHPELDVVFQPGEVLDSPLVEVQDSMQVGHHAGDHSWFALG